MNTLFENTLLKMGVGLQTMSASKVPAMLKNLFKSQTPLEKLNQERAALGYDPLTQSEWLAGTGGVAAQGLSDDFELADNYSLRPIHTLRVTNIYHDIDR